MSDNHNYFSKFKNMCENTNIWLAFRQCSDSEITVVNKAFYFDKNSYGETYANITTIIGQFMSSQWFSKELDIQRSYEFYVFSCDKNVSYKKICMELRRVKDPNYDTILQENVCDNTIFNDMDTFLLKSTELCAVFDELLSTYKTNKRIELVAKNSIHVINLYVSIKHLNLDNDKEITETVMIDTPMIRYYTY